MGEVKLKKLEKFISGFDRIIVAFSGGVDSSTLAGLASELVDVLAVTVISPTTPSREVGEAKRIAEELNLKHRFYRLNELEDENFVRNTEDRCYFCKKMVLTSLKNIAESEGHEAVFEGTNASELQGHRPGYRAVIELDGVYSPWAIFGFSKDEIREIAKKRGYSFWNKPSVACLSSRIPFNTPIDEKSLKMVDEAENYVIKIAGVRQVRVRKIGRRAVIEVGENEIEKLLNKDIIEKTVRKLKELGFEAVMLDLEGYKTGKLGELVGVR
jgi:uncharacterized protein